jgi:alginate O-acetyltransferase complex protein AlgI
MLFNSIEFAIFFPLVSAIFFSFSRQQWRVRWLLVASCVFYMAFIPAYIAVLLVTILIDYYAGMYIDRVDGRKKTALLVVSVISTCTVLFIFKYFNFFVASFIGAAGLFGWHPSPILVKIILPIGLSFHTFQSLSYVVEVYRGRQRPEHDLVVYATYVMFFPQLVAGPIERPQNLLHQFREWHPFNYADVTTGLRRMAWGFFKKLVVADRLALYVNDVYGAPRNYNGLQLTLATLFFAYQIYCDFSGYSDIAIGAAQVLGFRLMENFNTPYYSLSVSEFWRRWHISLSTWFRDYVYIPLGGSRGSSRRHIINLLLTFGISGLWHGANWTFLVWGLLNGVYLVAGTFTQSWRDRIFAALGLSTDSFVRKAIMLVSTFLLICLGWIIFRAHNIEDAIYIFAHLTRNWSLGTVSTPQFLARQLPVAVLSIVALECGQLFGARVRLPSLLVRMPFAIRWPLYAGFVILVVMFGIYRQTQFIYFQF